MNKKGIKPSTELQQVINRMVAPVLESDGNSLLCPNCGSDDKKIIGMELSVERGYLKYICSCDKCNLYYKELYRVTARKAVALTPQEIDDEIF